MKKQQHPKRSTVNNPSKANSAAAKQSNAARDQEDSTRERRMRILYGIFDLGQKHPNSRLHTLKELGRMLDPEAPLSDDTVSRIIGRMRDDLDMSIDHIPARHGHGFTKPVSHFPLDVISEEQVYHLIQSVQMLGVHRKSKAYKAIRKAVKRACLGITMAMRVRFEDLEKAMSFHVVGFDAPAPVDPELIEGVVRAILKRGEVKIEHRSAKRPGEVRARTVEPLHLGIVNHAPYVWHYDPVAAKEDKALAKAAAQQAGDGAPKKKAAKQDIGIRKYALTRIASFDETGREFEPRRFDIIDRLQRGMGAFDMEDTQTVRLRFTARVATYITERPLHVARSSEIQPDGSLVLTLETALTPELEAYILRWAGDVNVLEPAELRAGIRARAQALVAMLG